MLNFPKLVKNLGKYKKLAVFSKQNVSSFKWLLSMNHKKCWAETVAAGRGRLSNQPTTDGLLPICLCLLWWLRAAAGLVVSRVRTGLLLLVADFCRCAHGPATEAAVWAGLHTGFYFYISYINMAQNTNAWVEKAPFFLKCSKLFVGKCVVWRRHFLY